ncbi:MAG: hypothetical protein ABIH63_02585 [archaeon]
MAEESQEVNLSYVLSDLNARVRVLESKYSLFGERLLVINQNMIEEYKKTIRDIKTIQGELSEVKKEVFYLKEVLSDLNKEFDVFARKDQVKVLEKYINLWNPMSFVTEKDVINIIKREAGKKS